MISLLADAAAPSLFDWAGLANTLLGIVGTVAVGAIGAWKWLKTPLTKAIEEQGRTLEATSKTLNDLVSDVREVRTHQSGLSERVTSLERRVDNNLSRPRWRR